VTVPVFRAHLENGRVVADGPGRPAGAAIIVAELYTALGEHALPADSIEGTSPEASLV
jgi:hypothetical protein